MNHVIEQMLEYPIGTCPLYGTCVGRPAHELITRQRLHQTAVLPEDQDPSNEHMLAANDDFDSAVLDDDR